MGILLIVVGLGWALIGVGNVVTMLAKIPSGAEPGGIEVAAFILNVVLFVLPGLVVAALGEILRRRKAAAIEEDGERIPCRRCGERIPVAAEICRFCGTELRITH